MVVCLQLGKSCKFINKRKEQKVARKYFDFYFHTQDQARRVSFSTHKRRISKKIEDGERGCPLKKIKFASDEKKHRLHIGNQLKYYPCRIVFWESEYVLQLFCNIQVRIIINIIKSDTKSSYIFEETSKQNFTKQRHKFLYICTRVQRLGDGIFSQVYCKGGSNGKTSNNKHDWTLVKNLNVLHHNRTQSSRDILFLRYCKNITNFLFWVLWT